MTEQMHPVIIIGGGPVGLTSSILLSLRKIPHILFERHPSTSIHPKAAGINQRTTEIFRVMGIEDEVYAHAAPPEIAGRTAWYTSLGPDGKEIFSRDAWGGGIYEEEYAKHSPSRYCILPQIRLEPILKRRAMELNRTGILYNHEVLTAENADDRATVTVKNRTTGEISEHHARYLIVSDGGRSFTEKLGVSWGGEGGLLTMSSAHIRAPIRPLHPDNRNFMTWFTNPAMGGSTRTGYLYQLGPWPEAMTNPAVEEWMFACGLTEDDPPTFDEKTVLDRARRTIGIPELDIELISLSHWTVNALYASRWRVGRSFLVGDSAHRIPPWGALGMNSGIQDAQNLIWKLSLALHNEQKYDGLLDTYETERLEVGRRVGQTSLENMRSHSGHIDAAMGVSMNQTKAENIAAGEAFFDGNHPDYQRKQALIQEASRQLDTEFKAPGYEVGWFYPSADINSEGGETHNGQQLPDGTLVPHTYFVSTIPGHHLPHVWVENEGQTVAIRDLLDLDILTLFVENLEHWSSNDARTKVVVIGPNGWQDKTGEWQNHRAVGSSGGVLVRPDGIIAWRGDLADVQGQDWKQLVDRVLKAKN
ncbi:2,4-dichlorophenol 6-monooxygenase [Cercospora beticola]|uniref:2,4-dichlorophenol 6-monooxygenase n=1 Tax=Cercospora beticola TaxID=122368 RepID=A0A2G5HXB2_CERBT|nr:2,4-dichlorophenol 6-monooxygenase [Cercospora beticola]PIA97185.1 2,4-dichlorophenol 6-monooxygenase [Cercospora beticola]WPA99376.1 hypothetical protein RHO25_003993 [Cercospora beticola]CAK1360706.1 unnamed protein product [Cercospora beticola]